jgi:hypothetical protein
VESVISVLFNSAATLPAVVLTNSAWLFGVFDGHGEQGAKIAALWHILSIYGFTLHNFIVNLGFLQTAILGLFDKAEFVCCEILQDLCLDDCNIEVVESAFNFTESGEWSSTYKPSSKHYGL